MDGQMGQISKIKTQNIVSSRRVRGKQCSPLTLCLLVVYSLKESIMSTVEELTEQLRRLRLEIREADARAERAAARAERTEQAQQGEYFATIDEIWPNPGWRDLRESTWAECSVRVSRTDPPRFNVRRLQGDIRPPQEFRNAYDGAVNTGTHLGDSVTTVNDSLLPVDVFGKPRVAADKAHLLPKARGDAVTWIYPGCAVLGIPLEPFQKNVAEKAVLGCVGQDVKFPGIRNLLCNLLRLSNQGPCFDANPNVLIFPICTLDEAKDWKGQAYDALVVCSGSTEATRIGMNAVPVSTAATATVREINVAVGLASELCEFLARSVLEKEVAEVQKYQKSNEEKDKAADFFGAKKIKLPSALRELHAKPVFKVSFTGHSGPRNDRDHTAPDPMLTGFKSSNNWLRRHAGFRMVAATEPEEFEELSEDGQRNLAAYIKYAAAEDRKLQEAEILNPSGLEGGFRTVEFIS